MRVHSAIRASSIPPPSALLGTSGSARLIQAINDSTGATSYFGTESDPYRHISRQYMERYVEPARAAREQFTQLATKLFNPDVFRPLLTQDDFRSVPPCMHMSVLLHPDMRRLLEQGRISGWGYDPEHLPDEDMYGRMLRNGVADFSDPGSFNEDDYVVFNYEWDSTDPDLTEEELDAIGATREAIDTILKSFDYDPTMPDEDRG
jgi:hypothetical protein